MSTRILWFLSAAMAAVAAAGCGGAHATPQATFQTYRTALVRKDWKASLTCLTPQSRDTVVGGLMVAVASASVMNEEAAAVLEKHGIDRTQLVGDFLAGALANLASPGDALGEGVRRCLDKIADKPAFVGDAAGWLEQNSQQAGAYFGKVEGAELSSVEIDGDTAKGTLTLPVAGAKTALRFKRIEGRWLIDF